MSSFERCSSQVRRGRRRRSQTRRRGETGAVVGLACAATAALAAAPGPLRGAGEGLALELASEALAPANAALRHPEYGDAVERNARALRSAVRALDAGRLDEAEHHFARVGELGEVADYAALLWARGLREKGDAARAAAVALRALHEHPESPLRGELHQLLGDVRQAFGDGAAARAAWNQAMTETKDSARRAALRLSIAESLEADGKRDAAVELYRELWSDQPETREAEQAEARLAALGRGRAAQERSATAWRRRGDRLFRARRNERALAAYEKAIAGGLRGSELRRAQMQRGQTLFRLRRYPEAVHAFGLLPQKGDTQIWHARSLARAGEVMRAIEHFEAIARTEHNAIGLRATYLAALLLDGRNFEERAVRHFETVADSQHGLSAASLWRLAWADYRGKRFDRALPRLVSLRKREAGGIDGLRTRYWEARTREQLGDPEAARAFLDILVEYPFTYYALRARERIGPATVEPRSLEALGEGERGVSDRELARPRILVAAGLPDQAREELARLRRRSAGLRDRLELAQLYADAGDAHRAQRAILDGQLDTLARGPVIGYEALWWHAWPLAFGSEVEQATREPGSVSRDLVYAIMREESGYRPKVLSVSGARGLMQIMIPTGRQLARDVGLPGFEADDLFDPRTNVFLGTHYLGQLTTRFPDRPSAAIASYNAGPQAVAGWLADGAPPDDEWVESIPYDQTQRYVKRVLRSRHVYRVLY